MSHTEKESRFLRNTSFHSVFWMLASIAVFYYTDFYLTLKVDRNIRRLLELIVFGVRSWKLESFKGYLLLIISDDNLNKFAETYQFSHWWSFFLLLNWAKFYSSNYLLKYPYSLHSHLILHMLLINLSQKYRSVFL